MKKGEKKQVLAEGIHVLQYLSSISAVEMAISQAAWRPGSTRDGRKRYIALLCDRTMQITGEDVVPRHAKACCQPRKRFAGRG